jgi:hypothetical protein
MNRDSAAKVLPEALDRAATVTEIHGVLRKVAVLADSEPIMIPDRLLGELRRGRLSL